MCDECPDLIQEVRRIREANAAKFNHDLKAIYEDAVKRQKASGRKTISFPPRNPDTGRVLNRVAEKA